MDRRKRSRRALIQRGSAALTGVALLNAWGPRALPGPAPAAGADGPALPWPERPPGTPLPAPVAGRPEQAALDDAAVHSYHVLAYGAAPSASAAANARAIQAAINAAVKAGGGIVQAGAGTYEFDTPLEFSNGIIFRGVGRARTTLAYTGTGSAFVSANPDEQVLNAVWEDFTLMTRSGTHGIDVANLKYSRIQRVKVTGFSAVGIRLNGDGAGATAGAWMNIIDAYVNCGTAVAPQGTGILCTGGTHAANSNYITGTIIGNAIGIHIEKGNHNQCAYLDLEENTVAYKETQYAAGPLENSIHHSRFEGQIVANIEIANTTSPYAPTGTIIHSNHFVTKFANMGNAKGDIATPTQFILNGGFEDAAPLRNWAVAGREGSMAAETVQVFSGAGACRLTSTGVANVYLYQSLPAGAVSWFRNQRLSFVAFVKAGVADKVKLILYDDDGTEAEALAGSAHSGSGEWERLVVRKLIQNDATAIQLRVQIGAGVANPTDIYIDHCELWHGVVF